MPRLLAIFRIDRSQEDLPKSDLLVVSCYVCVANC